jgi:hypothetical protein
MPAFNFEARISLLEQLIAKIERAIRDLTQRVSRLEQNQWNATSPNGGNGGSGANAFYALSSSGSWGATGTWPSLTPGSISATVYQMQGTMATSLGTYTIYNWFPASPVNSKVMFLAPDGNGNFVVVSQSCT